MMIRLNSRINKNNKNQMNKHIRNNKKIKNKQKKSLRFFHPKRYNIVQVLLYINMNEIV